MNHLLMVLAAAMAPSGLLHPSLDSTYTYVRVDVDEQGAIQSMRFREGTGERLQEILRKRVQTWRFDPATAGGKPAPAQTTITIELRAGADGRSIEIASVAAGVAPLRVVAPKYLPPVGNTKQQGVVVLRCKVLASGRCSPITVERATAPESLQKNAITALARSRFETEVVSGVAVEPWILVPFCFSTGRRDSPACEVGDTRPLSVVEPSRVKLRDPLAQR